MDRNYNDSQWLNKIVYIYNILITLDVTNLCYMSLPSNSNKNSKKSIYKKNKNTHLQDLINNTETLNILDLLSFNYDILTQEKQEKICENNISLYQGDNGPINIWNYTILMPW